jgi:hypothetical protein
MMCHVVSYDQPLSHNDLVPRHTFLGSEQASVLWSGSTSVSRSFINRLQSENNNLDV